MKVDKLKEFDENCKLQRADNKRNELYQKTGEYLVDNCNILFAIRNGKPAKGIGGTDDIVKYARESDKYIIHINSDTLKLNI